MVDEQRVIVRHNDGREYAVRASDFNRLAASDFAGFSIASNEDRTDYVAADYVAAVTSDDSFLGTLGLTEPQRAALVGAGITTADDLTLLSDDDLDALDGIGPATVERIRAAAPASEDGD